MTKAATTAEGTLRMVMGRTHTAGAGVGEMAGAIILTLTSTIPGRDITDTAATIRSSTTAEAAASGMQGGGGFHGGGGGGGHGGGGGGHR